MELKVCCHLWAEAVYWCGEREAVVVVFINPSMMLGFVLEAGPGWTKFSFKIS
jgi:hypothetical protein